jgi:hypothetical protein
MGDGRLVLKSGGGIVIVDGTNRIGIGSDYESAALNIEAVNGIGLRAHGTVLGLCASNPSAGTVAFLAFQNG